MKIQSIVTKKYLPSATALTAIAIVSASWAISATAAAPVYPPPAQPAKAAAANSAKATLPPIPSMPPKASAITPETIKNQAKSALPAPSESDIKAFKSVMSNVPKLNKALWVKGAQIRKEMNEMLIKPKFDKTNYMAKVAELEGVQAKAFRNRSEVLSAYVAKLTPEKRKIIMAHFLKMNPQRVDEIINSKPKNK